MPYKHLKLSPATVTALEAMGLRLLAETMGSYTASDIADRLIMLGIEALPVDTPLVRVFGVSQTLRTSARVIRTALDLDGAPSDGSAMPCVPMDEPEVSIDKPSLPIQDQPRFWPVLGAKNR